MTKEEIVEEIAEGIYQYSSCFEEVVEKPPLPVLMLLVQGQCCS